MRKIRYFIQQVEETGDWLVSDSETETTYPRTLLGVPMKEAMDLADEMNSELPDVPVPMIEERIPEPMNVE